MPRGRSSSSSRSRSSSYGGRSSFSRSPQPQRSVPQRSYQQSMPVQQRPGMMGGLGSTLMTGMAFGAGSEIAHQAVRGVMGGSSHGGVQQSGQEYPQEQPQQQQQQQQEPIQQQHPCMNYNMKFVECLKSSGNDISDCQNFFNDLKQCEQGFK